MHWGFGFGLWPLFGIFWVLLLVCLARNVFRHLSGRGRYWAFEHRGVPHMTHEPHGYRAQQASFPLSALDILCQRYARGEIDAATFDQMRERIENAARPAQ